MRNTVWAFGASALLLTILLAGPGCKAPATEAPIAQDATREAPTPVAQGVPVPEASAGEGPSTVGKPCPDFTVTDVDGNTRSLKDYRGRIVVVDFWATYCKPCVKKLREYESVYQAMKGKEVDFLALSSDPDDAVIKGWREANAVTIPLARMDDATRQAFFGPVQFVTIPQLRVVDTDGIIRHSLGPDSTTPELEAAIKALLAKQ